ncbi:galactose mutarotase-like isoform X3 [Frieseomelitta varia]|uniref:galactose mutarotase-like isoform X3 n=1 Tax=Frieseomelitta varia TaxID=561572 RepID=UPI001CB6B64D|nr:galactose mutarotase-like isoform X3 [Frieseomelitta varia]
MPLNMDFHGCNCKNVTITEGIFGEVWIDNKDQIFNDPLPKMIKSYTMINTNRMEVVVITWGATIASLKCPDKYGHSVDIVLGFDDMKGYSNPITNPFIGCILGRCANRIKDGHITIRSRDYELTKNDFNGKHHLHGGTNGFGRKVWDSYIAGCSVVMSYLSQDGEEGYPGAVLTTIKFKLTPENKLNICMRATTSKPTIVNLSHGSMFNLAGHDSGELELRKHKVLLNCDRWTFADYTDPVPTGAIHGVGGTAMDFRIPRILGEYMGKDIEEAEEIGEVYKTDDKDEEEMKVVKRYKKITVPKKLEFILGKHGTHYKKYCAFSIQPQNYPNAIHYSHFPCSILYPGQVYYHDLTYKFEVHLANYM